MQMDFLNREELQSILFQLEQALYNHQQWYNLIIRSLICRLPADKHDVSEDAHKECRFGQWYHNFSSDKLSQNPGFIALGIEHQQMHKLAAQLLLENNNGITINPKDYDHFANVLERMRLELSGLQKELSEYLYNHDALTGAINRISMLSVLREQHALVKRNVQSCCIAMLDLDHFKEINDTFGHVAGDSVLASVSRFIMANMRPYDKFFRVGGEEFLICLQNCDTSLCFEMIERLRKGIAELVVHSNENEPIKVTASFGITSIDSNISVEQCIERADEALYKAKHNNRNCTYVWGLE